MEPVCGDALRFFIDQWPDSSVQEIVPASDEFVGTCVPFSPLLEYLEQGGENDNARDRSSVRDLPGKLAQTARRLSLGTRAA